MYSYAINGVALDNRALGWHFMDGSEPFSGYSDDLPSLKIPGQDGQVDFPGTTDAPSIPLVVLTPTANYEALASLFRSQPHLLSNDRREIGYNLASLVPQPMGAGKPVVMVTAILTLPGVFWRDVDSSTSAATDIDASSVDVSVFSGLSAPVRDAIVRVAGQVTGLKVADSQGSFFTYTKSLPSGSFLRFDSATGKTWVTDSDVWTGGTEVTGDIGNGPGAYPLSIFPSFTDPTSRAGVLTVTSTARSGASIQVRGKAAYVV